MRPSPAIQIADVSFAYGSRQALADVSLQIAPGEIVALLGPNGGGKSTLFRLLSTLIPLQAGEVHILGHSARTQAGEIRRRAGIVFQFPSVDAKLRVRENIRHQGWLYGLAGTELRDRGADMLRQVGLSERANDYVETLSGGLRRRLELAKALLHRPAVLLMDEPSTGLDPAARYDFWRYLREIREEHGVTVLLTTHLLEEAERADRVAILSAGKVVACGPPDELRRDVGGETITINAAPQQAAGFATEIAESFAVEARQVDETIHIAAPNAAQLVAPLVERFGARIAELRLGKPTLEDVFIARTGHRFWNSAPGDEGAASGGKQKWKGARHG